MRHLCARIREVDTGESPGFRENVGRRTDFLVVNERTPSVLAVSRDPRSLLYCPRRSPPSDLRRIIARRLDGAEEFYFLARRSSQFGRPGFRHATTLHRITLVASIRLIPTCSLMRDHESPLRSGLSNAMPAHSPLPVYRTLILLINEATSFLLNTSRSIPREARYHTYQKLQVSTTLPLSLSKLIARPIVRAPETMYLQARNHSADSPRIQKTHATTPAAIQ